MRVYFLYQNNWHTFSTQVVESGEARIALESVLTHDALKAKLGADLAGRCQELLDQRANSLVEVFNRAGYQTMMVGDFAADIFCALPPF